MSEPEFNELLGKYVDAVLRVGVNLQKGQRLAIRSDVQDVEMVRSVATRAYQLGASFVDVFWDDEKLLRARFDYADPETLNIIPDWGVKFRQEHGERGDASLVIYSTDPDLLDGIEPESVSTYRKSFLQKYEPTFKYIDNNNINWNVISTATPAWAKKIFPELPQERAQERLWEVIFKTCRIYLDDPVQVWKEHIESLHKRCQYMNAKKYESLHYQAPGTDLKVGFPENNLWIGGATKSTNGIEFVPNMPTEEIFTMPHKNKVDGVISSSRPLVYMGTRMDGFTLTFENGRVTKATAKTGEEHLIKLLDTDEFARQLGEVALVPHSSQTSQQNIVFYNLLFDENTASHLALGSAYQFTLEGGTDMSKEEFTAHGGNDSLIHVDFMVGSSEMDIDGITEDGVREPVMRRGEWAFDL